MIRFILKKVFPIVLVFAYLFLPLDILPDFFGPLGRMDDLIMLGLLAFYLISGKSPIAILGQRLGWRQPRRPHAEPGSAGTETQEEKEETDPYRILEVDRRSPIEEVHRAYRRQVGRYHPDRVSHLGTEFQRLAHRKFIRIQKAYEEILRARGVAS